MTALISELVWLIPYRAILAECIEWPDVLAKWKKLLVVCILGTIPGQWAAAGVLAKASAAENELAFWNSIKDSTRPKEYESYLQAFPMGHFASLARGRIERLGQAEPRAELASTETTLAVKAPRKKPRPVRGAAKMPPAAVPAPEAPPPAVLPMPDEPVLANLKESTDCPACPTMVELPKGLLTMGSDTGDAAERPSHSVALGAAFAIGKHGVTVEQWKACVDADACPRLTDDTAALGTEPVGSVSWDDAQQYVEWLSDVTGRSYRLPTEAEWEYAARGGQIMNGGVREWVSDCWHGSYLGAPPDGSDWDEPDCRVRVIRGGASPAVASARSKHEADMRNPLNGLRVARDVEPPQ